MDPASQTLETIAFGRFRLVPERRELLLDGQAVSLGSRAFDVAGDPDRSARRPRQQACTHGTGVAQPDCPREQSGNPISALRAALGPERDLIHTISGRGYRFLGELRFSRPAPSERSAPAPAAAAGADEAGPGPVPPPTNLPVAVSDLIGRDDDLHRLLRLVAAHQTRHADRGRRHRQNPACARRRAPIDAAVQRWRLDRRAGTLVRRWPGSGCRRPGAQARTFRRADLSQSRGRRPEQEQLLLVLDNCEHVIDAAAVLAEVLSRGNPAVHLIATSREPLRAQGEWIYRVPPLAFPSAGAEELRRSSEYGAVRLFVERTRATQPDLVPTRRRCQSSRRSAGAWTVFRWR